MATPTVDNEPTLPIIDISPFLAPSSSSSSAQSARASTARALAHACRATGFFYLTGHGIPAATLAHVLALARRFFLDTSAAEKALIARRDAGVVETVSADGADVVLVAGDGARGYQRIGENVTGGRRDWHEAVDLYAESSGAKEPPYGVLEGRNLWPARPAELRGVYEEYIERLKVVGTAVARAMGEALGLGDGGEEDADVFVSATRGSFWVMRLIGYPGLPEGEGQEEGLSCGEHTDYGCVTLLLADDTPNALRVQRRDGSWITANPKKGTFLVNIGDMIQRWTNGLWKSTNHCVIHRGANYRVSVPFFFEPDFDARIKPLARCVAVTGGKAKYDEVVYGEHLLRKVKGNFY